MNGRTAQFADDGVEAAPLPGLLIPAPAIPQHLLDGGEIVLLAIKPSMWFLGLVSARWLVAATAAMLLAPWLSRLVPALEPRVVVQTALLIAVLRLVAALLQWSSRWYILTNRRVLSYHGVLQVNLFEAPLVQVRNTYVRVRQIERLCGAGSIGFSSQGSRRIDAWWDHVADPQEVHARVRRAIERALDNHGPRAAE